MLVSMTEAEWDDVVAVHLKGHFVPTRFAAAHWREQAKAGHEVRAAIINTSSTSGLLGNPGQTNYGAAKAGIASFSIICAQELGRYGVRSNCIAPAARTRLTEGTPGLGEMVAPPSEGFDVWDPANVAPLVAYLAMADCPITGRTFFVQGGLVRVMEPWQLGARLERDHRWTIDDLAKELPGLVG
jgi:NAD(P)-dependent dehydrogenase (short-subunit alcohol dehydrogenase family)